MLIFQIMLTHIKDLCSGYQLPSSSLLPPSHSLALDTQLIIVSTFATPLAQGQGSPRALLGSFPTWREISMENNLRKCVLTRIHTHAHAHTHTFFSCPQDIYMPINRQSTSSWTGLLCHTQPEEIQGKDAGFQQEVVGILLII